MAFFDLSLERLWGANKPRMDVGEEPISLIELIPPANLTINMIKCLGW